jgi:hypothetical protein
MSLSPLGMIFVGFLLALTGVILPFLMVAHIISSTFFLNFFSYGASLAGLFLGVIGASRYIRENRK